MEIIDLKLLDDYSYGKDNNGKAFEWETLDKLEDDSDFMMGSICKTNDYKTYLHCSEALKLNFKFVKWYVNKFKDNIVAIDNIAKNFLNNSNNPSENFELAIMMKDLADEYDRVCVLYGMYAENIAIMDEVYIAAVIKETSNELLKEYFGLGFSILENKYNYNEVILDFYAKRMLNDIYYYNKKNIEIDIHETFKSPEEFNKYGTHNYLIGLLSKFDKELSLYVQKNPDILNNIILCIKDVLPRWNHFERKVEKIRLKQIIKVYNEYSSNNCDSENYYDILQYIIKQYNISEEIFDLIDDIYEDNLRMSVRYVERIINDSSFDIDKYNLLIDTINSILSESNPELIKEISMPKCKVTNIRKKDVL